MHKRTAFEVEMGEKTLESLAREIGDLDDKIEKSTEAFVLQMRNVNTVRKSTGDVQKFSEWLQIKNDETRNLWEIPASELDICLARFFMTATKKNGDEFEPDTLKSIQCSINRFLAEKNAKINTIEDCEFKHSRDVMVSKRKLLRQQGKGNKTRRADPLTQDEIDILYTRNFLGGANARALINTIFLNNSMYFGTRSRNEHVNLRWGDIELKESSTGEKFLELSERATKTRTGATGETRAFTPKMFEDKGNPRCPVSMYLLFREKRPSQMLEEDSPFYIGVNNKKSNRPTWYVCQPMGKNTLGNIIKSMCESAGIQGRKVNHSARKTAITTLVHAGVPPTLVQQHSGHKNIASINNYSMTSLDQQKGMSGLICDFVKRKDDATNSENDFPQDSALYDLPLEVIQEIENYEIRNEVTKSANEFPYGLLTHATINGNVNITIGKAVKL